MPTFSFTWKCVDADGRVAFLPDTITVNDPPVAGTITLTPRTITASGETVPGTSRTVSASMTLGSNLRLTTSDGVVSVAEWGVDVVAGDYEVRVTPVGAATFDGPAAGVWHALSEDRTWGDSYTAAFAGAQSTQLLVEIRDIATETIRASATFTYALQITETAAAVRLTDGAYDAYGLSLGLAPAESAVTIFFQSTGVLRIYRGGNQAAATEILPPNEWGPSLVASNYEVLFEIVTDDPQVTFDTFPGFGVWANLGVDRSAQALLRNESNGVIFGECAIRASVRPVGGVTVASALYTISLSSERYPSGIIP